MNTSIRRRLIQVEGDLLSALMSGEDSLSSFEAGWSSLQTDVAQATLLGEIEEETMTLAHTVASRVSIIADRFMDIHLQQGELAAQLHSDLQDILEGVNQTHLSLPTTVDRPNDHSHSLPPFIALAYTWLLKNIHDPYPSNELKASFARSADSSTQVISAWFTNVRRRMGWTTLSRQYFSNCRADTLDAAYRALVQEDPKRTLEPEIIHAFMVVKVTAEGLYSAKFKKSALAGQLDLIVKDMTDEDRLRMANIKSQDAQEEKKRKEVEKERRRQERVMQRAILKAGRSASKSYPSPSGSPYETPVPALEDSVTEESGDEEDHVFPETWTGNKRRTPSSSSIATPDRHDEHSLKRHRPNLKESGAVACGPVSALPSPPSEADINHDAFDYWAPEVVELPVSLATQSLPALAQPHNRKRRLSDGASQGAPKRPRGLVGPRLHAVSDPLPKTIELADDFNAWLMGNFEIPPAVADEVPDPSTLLDVDVECYNWSSMQDCYKLPVDDTPMLASPPYSTQPYNSFNVDPNLFSTDINPLSTGDNLDELYQNIFGTNSHHPPPYSSQPVDGAASSLTCVTSDSGITSAPPSMSFSDDFFSDGGAWSHLPSYTDALSSFNPSSTHSSIPVSSDPLNLSSILSEIDLSMLQLPTSSPDIPRQNEGTTRFADKQAKLEQLRMLEEAKRRLEAELAIDA